MENSEYTNLGRVGLYFVEAGYSATTQFEYMDFIVYNGNAYVCIKDCKGIEPTNTEYWKILAKKGDKGDNAVLNGYNTVLITQGNNISLSQEEGTLTISAIVPTKTTELTNDSNFAYNNSNNNFSAPQTINGTLTVNGNIVQNGQSYETHAEEIYTTNDVIITRDKAQGGLSSGEFTGIKALKYDGQNNGLLVFDNNGTARVGDENDTEPLATRKESVDMVNGEVLVWESEYNRIKTGNINSLVQNATKKVATVIPDNNILVEKTHYYLGETTELTIKFPTTNELGNFVAIRFFSGETPTVLTFNDTNIKGDIDLIPLSNKTYEIYAEYDGANWLIQYLGY